MLGCLCGSGREEDCRNGWPREAGEITAVLVIFHRPLEARIFVQAPEVRRERDEVAVLQPSGGSACAGS